MSRQFNVILSLLKCLAESLFIFLCNSLPLSLSRLLLLILMLLIPMLLLLLLLVPPLSGSSLPLLLLLLLLPLLPTQPPLLSLLISHAGAAELAMLHLK
jgi:hypothetical protein